MRRGELDGGMEEIAPGEWRMLCFVVSQAFSSPQVYRTPDGSPGRGLRRWESRAGSA
jgi:hypothetical protein